jgi:hypothetical protein
VSDGKTKPWMEERFGVWEFHPGYGNEVRVNVGVNQTVEIDKLYGPLAAHGVRVRLEYEGERTDWVVEYKNLKTGEWIEKARWDCQEDWPTDDD